MTVDKTLGASITSPIGPIVTLVIMYVETFKTDVNVFIGNVRYKFDVTLTDEIHYHHQSQFVDAVTDNII